ncbi:MAG: hypothetical protein ABSG89_11280 [Bacteroidales bacterium]|jgi:hypothetical protein
MHNVIKTSLTVLIFLSVSAIVFSQNDTIAKTDSSLLKQIERQLNEKEPPASPAQVRTAPSTLPDISVIGDFQSSYINDAKRNFDAGINEAELSLQSVVDPYARADFFFTLERDPLTGKYSEDLEEGYLTTLSLPAHLQLKVGRFKGALGRINPVHSHALPFISLPEAFQNYFGEGINDDGVSLSWLVPNSLFYQELVVQVTDGPIESPSFSRSVGNTYLELVHLKNFFDLTSNATLELGFSGITGANPDTLRSNIAAMDLTYKWKPVQYNTYKSFTWQSEGWFSNANTAKDHAVNTFGMYSLINFQFSRRMFFTGIYSYSNKPFSANTRENAYSVTIGWYATEFQKIEIEGKTVSSNVNSEQNQILLRWIFVIGTHGAHQY